MQPDASPSCYEPVMDVPTLLAALADDLDHGFEGFVRARQGRVYSIALRILGDPAEAEDAAQDTFVRAYRALGSWPPTRIHELRLDAWLATIVVNAARTRIRRRSNAARESLTFLDELDHPSASPAETPHDRLARTEVSEAWALRLLALPERYRAPIVLRHVDGLGYDEIALALGRPEGTVKAQVHRGLTQLRAILEAERRVDPDPDPDRATDATTGDRPPDPVPLPHLQEVSR
jgi:RNA polymerase sigma factor (sigma-70 family)